MSGQTPGKHLAFVSSALAPASSQVESFDFFAILLAGIVRNANQAGHRVSVFVPERNNATDSDQGEVLQKVLSSAREFEAIIIAPFDTAIVTSHINDYFRTLKAEEDYDRRRNRKARPHPLKPIIFIDKRIDPARLEGELPKGIRVHSIECANHNGGEMAAELLYSKLDIDNRKQRFMILSGLEGGEDRVAGFHAYLATQGVLASSITTPKDRVLLNFTRSGARQWMDREFDRLILGQVSLFGSLEADVAWGIFACNDEMALGVRSVVSARSRQISERLKARLPRPKDAGVAAALKLKRERDHAALKFLEKIRIVGFDGIGPVLELLSPGGHEPPDPWLVGTIAAEVRMQTLEAIRWIDRTVRDPDGSVDHSHLVPVTPVSAS